MCAFTAPLPCLFLPVLSTPFLRWSDARSLPAASTQSTGWPLSPNPRLQTSGIGQLPIFFHCIPEGVTGRPPRWCRLPGTGAFFPTHPTLPSSHLSSFLALNHLQESWPGSPQPLPQPLARPPHPLPVRAPSPVSGIWCSLSPAFPSTPSTTFTQCPAFT